MDTSPVADLMRHARRAHDVHEATARTACDRAAQAEADRPSAPQTAGDTGSDNQS